MQNIEQSCSVYGKPAKDAQRLIADIQNHSGRTGRLAIESINGGTQAPHPLTQSQPIKNRETRWLQNEARTNRHRGVILVKDCNPVPQTVQSKGRG